MHFSHSREQVLIANVLSVWFRMITIFDAKYTSSATYLHRTSMKCINANDSSTTSAIKAIDVNLCMIQ